MPTVTGKTIYGYTQTVNGSSGAVTLPASTVVQLKIVSNVSLQLSESLFTVTRLKRHQNPNVLLLGIL